MTFNYDVDDDVLYVTFSKPKGKVRYAENASGDVIRYDAETNEIVGVTILFLSLRSSRGDTISIPEVGVVPFSPAMIAALSGKDSGGVKGKH